MPKSRSRKQMQAERIQKLLATIERIKQRTEIRFDMEGNDAFYAFKSIGEICATAALEDQKLQLDG